MPVAAWPLGPPIQHAVNQPSRLRDRGGSNLLLQLSQVLEHPEPVPRPALAEHLLGNLGAEVDLAGVHVLQARLR